MKKFLKIVLFISLGFIVFTVIGTLLMMNSDKKNLTSNDSVNVEESTTPEESTNVIFDASSVSKISSEELISKIGEPLEKEDWVYNDSFNVCTYSYDIDGNHYEFIFAENSIIRLSIYSSLDWNGTGDDFHYVKDDKSDIFSMFGVSPSSNYSTKSDNGFTFRVGQVSDNISDFNVQMIDSTNKTFKLVKITYDEYYFN